jgi:hypothetical protein
MSGYILFFANGIRKFKNFNLKYRFQVQGAGFWVQRLQQPDIGFGPAHYSSRPFLPIG